MASEEINKARRMNELWPAKILHRLKALAAETGPISSEEVRGKVQALEKVSTALNDIWSVVTDLKLFPGAAEHYDKARQSVKGLTEVKDGLNKEVAESLDRHHKVLYKVQDIEFDLERFLEDREPGRTTAVSVLEFVATRGQSAADFRLDACEFKGLIEGNTLDHMHLLSKEEGNVLGAPSIKYVLVGNLRQQEKLAERLGNFGERRWFRLEKDHLAGLPQPGQRAQCDLPAPPAGCDAHLVAAELLTCAVDSEPLLGNPNAADKVARSVVKAMAPQLDVYREHSKIAPASMMPGREGDFEVYCKLHQRHMEKTSSYSGPGL
ncbi:hypothetical protein [Ferrimonas marina]|uniref:Uncharacterized protein n=1 Tax=Ferrimonas marina TaxID=299255 RepID=A0A1M5UAH6_9GAMM|nr:hypothetical protein [Ferrimonas marina]SHH59940.1 hypothetical protein SAMN02745129_2476 [Ferrimonas marina]